MMSEATETIQQALRRTMKDERQVPTKRRVGGRGPAAPYRLLTLLLYGRVPGIKRLGNGVVIVNTTELAQFMRIQNNRLRFYAEKLDEWGVIEDAELNQGNIVITLARPLGWDDE
jgi:hypothetical protein